MNSHTLNAKRLIVDLQACQTEGSAKRGVGRYSWALFNSLLDNSGGSEIRALVARELPYQPELDHMSQSRVSRIGKLPDWGTDRAYNGGAQDSLDALSLSAMLAGLKSDVIHVSHVFEGFSDRVALPSPKHKPAGQLLSATLYDLIPLIFREHYFQSPEFRRWYYGRLEWLRQADLLLAISESSRQDAINLLGIDPRRITTIHGGIGAHFKPAVDRQPLYADLARRYGLGKRIVLYTGGDDHRKNIKGAIAGFAAVPRHLRVDCQLVVICAMGPDRRSMYLDIAHKAGLADSEILLTGYVPEGDLLAFYQTCDAFVFPSLYEGLGLPVLEAMACGAPVLGGDNSSIKELIGRKDALFDAGSAASIAGALVEVLSHSALRQDLSGYGVARAAEFSWNRTGKKALDAIADAVSRSTATGVQAAVNGWVPQMRMAMVTPLPPCRSGIADYNAEFLPFLARHFEIDLYVDGYSVTDEVVTSSFPIRQASDLDALAHNYDVILYEFGNSEFHCHMVDLLKRHPGVVGLHDAYLSGLFGYFDFYLGDSGSYAREMLTAHGPRARRFFSPRMKNPEPNGSTMVELPCTKRVLDAAIGIISHSPFNLQLAQSSYPEGWGAPYRVIPQMISLPAEPSAATKLRARSELGFHPEDVVITTFGHIAWTKWGDRLLEAFLASRASISTSVHLVFAGELAKDDFGMRLKESVASSGISSRIRVTGFLSEHDYEAYLQASDVAIQLRTKSRGGTPRGVLDCMAHGVPVIVNNDASYRDYPDSVVFKIPADPSQDDIANAIDGLVNDAHARSALSSAARAYVAAHHDPATCASQYAAAIHEFVQRAASGQASSYASLLAPLLARCADADAATALAAGWLGQLAAPVFSRPRLFIDVSFIAEKDYKTGIQRVVRETVQELYCSSRAGFEPVAVELLDGKLHVANRWLQTLDVLARQEEDSHYGPIEFRAGDVLLMLDSSWWRYGEFAPVFDDARKCGVPVHTALYDLLPIRLPEGNFVPGGREPFEKWVTEAIAQSDGIVCISRSVAEDLADYIATRDVMRAPKIGYWHLGSDFEELAEAGHVGQAVTDMRQRDYLLMVGTIEPRKCHSQALDILERMWAGGSDLTLCIAGREGWMVGDLMTRIKAHPLYGDKLFFFDGPSDAEMEFLYREAAGLLFFSKGEGFGLPLVEAANHGIPIVCSDIPVFREIAREFAWYIEHDDVENAAASIARWWTARNNGTAPDSSLMPRLTWEQSAEELLSVVLDNDWMKV
jgi:glycosyltransferase involved in cell wall biosynthesis